MTPLVFEQFMNDPRLQKGKQLLYDTLLEYQSKIAQIKPPDPDRKLSYQQLIARFSEYRGAPLWYPYLGSGMGNGALVELADGSVKYDFISGIGTHFGHGQVDVVYACLDAALQDVVMQGNLEQNTSSVEFCKVLIEQSRLDHCFLTSSGAMACENALKIIFQKKEPAQRILAFERNFMGRTLLLSNITDKPSFREGLPQPFQVDYLPFNEQAIPKLEALLAEHPDQYAAMCFELIQGEGGYYAGSTELFTSLMKILKQHSVAVLVDEIQTLGRTPSLFAFQHFELSEYVDVVTFGKLTQVCGTLFRDSFRPRAGLISQTFTGSTSAIESGLAILHELIHSGYLGPDGKIEKYARLFQTHLAQLSQKYPQLIKGPFGYGLMVAATVLGGEPEKVKMFLNKLFDAGVIAFSCGATPMRVRMLVPLGSVHSVDIDNVMEIFEKVLVECSAS